MTYLKGFLDCRRLAEEVCRGAARDNPVDDRFIHGWNEAAEANADAISALPLPPEEGEEVVTRFAIQVDDGPEQPFAARHSVYRLAALEAFGRLGLPYPCTIRIWMPELVAAGYPGFTYRIDNYVDRYGQEYGFPAVMQVTRAALTAMDGGTDETR